MSKNEYKKYWTEDNKKLVTYTYYCAYIALADKAILDFIRENFEITCKTYCGSHYEIIYRTKAKVHDEQRLKGLHGKVF